MGNQQVNEHKKGAKQYKGGDTEPDDVNLYRSMTLPDRIFNVSISNIKLKNLPDDTVFMTLMIPNTPLVKLEKRKVENGVWNQKPHNVQITCNEYQLRIQFLVVSLYCSDNKIYHLKLNLYKIASGPAHLTFPLGPKGKQQGRISLNVHFSQLVNVNIQATHAQAILDKSCPQHLFNFTIRAITRSEKDQQDSSSSAGQKQLSRNNQGKNVKSNSSEYRPIIWINTSDKKLPKISRKVGYSDLPQSTIQFMMWQCDNTSESAQNKLIGQCYISFTRCFNSDPISSVRDNRLAYVYKAIVEDKLWLNGKRIGKAKLQLSIQIDHCIKQNLMLVRTQFGPQLTSPVFDTTKQRVQCPQIIELQKLEKQIQEGLSKMHSINPAQSVKVQDARNNVLTFMIQMLAILQSSKKQSVRFFIYKSQKDLLNGQQCFLNIAIRLLQKLEQDEAILLKQFCWKILIAIIQRGQLQLAHTGFTQQQKKSIKQDSMNKYLKDKFKFSLQYQQFLYKSLGKALRSMESKNLETIERKFVEFYCAFCYLRVPQFRQQLILAVGKKTDKNIEEDKVIDVGIEDEKQIQLSYKNDQNLSYLYDWKGNFYSVISSDPKYTRNVTQLTQILNATGWKERMQKRGVAFFLFLNYWVQYIQIAAVISKNVKWYYLPGYSVLVKALVSQMYRRDLLDYPDALKQVSTKMLANQRLFNIFIQSTIKKMNLMQFNSIVTGLDLLSGYLKQLNTIKTPIPTTFNYTTFLEICKKIIQHDHSSSTSACLKLIYDYYNMFSFEFKKQINQFLLGKMFFRLFLSWSLNIRVLFHHLLLFRIIIQSNILVTDKKSQQNNQEVKKKYLFCLNILQNLKAKTDEDQVKLFEINKEKQYFKKMRRKLINSKKNGDQKEQVVNNDKLKEDKYSISELSKTSKGLKSHLVYLQTLHIPHGFKQNSQKFTYESSVIQDDSEIRNRKKSGLQYETPQLPLQIINMTNQCLNEFKEIQQQFNKFYVQDPDFQAAPQLAVKIQTDDGQFRTAQSEQW